MSQAPTGAPADASAPASYAGTAAANTAAAPTAAAHPAAATAAGAAGGGSRGVRNLVAAARVVSLAEATSFLLLLVATAVKYGADQELGVKVLGPVHGGLFLAYCALVLGVGFTCRWSAGRTLLALGASVLPVAPFFVERAWLRSATPGTPTPGTLRPDAR